MPDLRLSIKVGSGASDEDVAADPCDRRAAGEVRPRGPVGEGRSPPLHREPPVKTLKNLLGRIVRDDRGGEVLEYALIAGLIVVACIAVIGTVGTKVLGRWNSLSSSL